MSELQNNIERFKVVFNNGIEKIAEAAQIYVDAIDKNENALNIFKDALPGIPHGVWYGLEAVGRGWLDKRLLWGGGKASTKMKQISFTSQKKALDNGVEVLSSDGTGLIVKVENLTQNQIKQVFSSNHIRSIAEQKALIENQIINNVLLAPKIEYPYEIKKGKIIIKKPLTLNAKDLKRMLKEIS